MRRASHLHRQAGRGPARRCLWTAHARLRSGPRGCACSPSIPISSYSRESTDPASSRARTSTLTSHRSRALRSMAPPRSLIADLTQRLMEAGAAAVAF